MVNRKDTPYIVDVALCVILGIVLGSLLGICLKYKQTATEPETVRCYDCVYGVVYGCEVREDGDIEIKLDEDGNRVIVGLCEKDPRYK